ncbi:hypothetical protein [Kaarinaea lacus]
MRIFFQFLLIVLLFSIIGTGCSRTVKVENMTPGELNIVNKHPYSVYVLVKGDMSLSSAKGKKDEIDRERLQQVIESSIIKSGLFQSLAPREQADYLLEVVVFKSNVIGVPTATITTAVPMNWVLMSREPQKSIYQDRTEHQFTVKLREKLGPANRYSWANEGSVKLSIEQALWDISKLQL